MTYDEELTDSFYRKFLSVPQSVASCQVHVYLSLDNSLNLNNASLTSDCFSLNIGSLHFPQGLRHTISLPGITTSDSLLSLMILSYQLSHRGSTYKVGRFTFLDRGNDPVLEVSFSSSVNELTGKFYSVNISLLNSQSTSDFISITDDRLNFQAQSKIFSNYDVQIVGSLTANDSSGIELDGEFLGSFRSDVSSYLSQHLQNELQDVIDRSNKVIESVHISERWRDELHNQLLDINNKLSQEEKVLMQSNESLADAKIEASNAMENLTRALSDYIMGNNSLSLSDLLCNDGDACGSSCSPRLSCSIHDNAAVFSVPGSCAENKLVDHITRHAEPVLVKEWQQQTQCQTCWKIMWYKYIYFSQTKCCTDSKIPVDIQQYKIQYINSTVNESAATPCTIFNNTQSFDAFNCQKTPCSHQFTNTSCLNVTMSCLQDRGMYFVTINSTVSQMYLTYLNALVKEEEIKLILVRKNINVYRLKENAKFLKSLIAVANQSYHINIRANESLFEETDTLIPIVGSFNAPPVIQFDVLTINNVSFHVILTNHTPATLPVTVAYTVLNNDKEQSFVDTVNFLQPRELILRQLSGSILDSYVSLASGSTREKRNSHKSMSSTLSSRNKFHDTCLRIKGSRMYIEQIFESLQQSFNNFNNTVNIITTAAAKILPESRFDEESSLPAIAAQYDLLEADIYTLSNLTIHLLQNNSFASWQAQREVIHSSIDQIELFGCSSYIDCLGSITSQLEDILEDTPNAVQELNKLRRMKKNMLKVAYNKSLSYDEGHSTLNEFLTLIESSGVIGKWCIEPPTITSHPVPFVSAEVNSSIELSCTASSSSVSYYYWVKDSNIIPHSNSNKLILTNIRLEDEGEYQCVAVNDAGSSTSLPSLVYSTMKPVLNLTLPSKVYVHEGDRNGFPLMCDAYGIPNPGWMWFYKESKDLPWTVTPGPISNVLMLNSPTIKDEGWYQCMAINSAGNITGTPVFVSVLPTTLPTVQYTFILVFSKAQEEWVKPIINSIVLEANISSFIVTSSRYSVFSSNMSSITFTVQTDDFNNIMSTDTNVSESDSDEWIAETTHSVSQLENDRDALSSLLQGINEMSFIFNDNNYTVSLVHYAIGPRTFSCSEGYQLDSDHLMCGMLMLQ